MFKFVDAFNGSDSDTVTSRPGWATFGSGLNQAQINASNAVKFIANDGAMVGQDTGKFNHYVQCVAGANFGGDYFPLCVRVVDRNEFVGARFRSGADWEIYYNNSRIALLAGSSCTAGDVIKLLALGSNAALYRNGALILSAAIPVSNGMDTTHTKVGMLPFSSSGGASVLDSWESGVYTDATFSDSFSSLSAAASLNGRTLDNKLGGSTALTWYATQVEGYTGGDAVSNYGVQRTDLPFAMDGKARQAFVLTGTDKNFVLFGKGTVASRHFNCYGAMLVGNNVLRIYEFDSSGAAVGGTYVATKSITSLGTLTPYWLEFEQVGKQVVARVLNFDLTVYDSLSYTGTERTGTCWGVAEYFATNPAASYWDDFAFFELNSIKPVNPKTKQVRGKPRIARKFKSTYGAFVMNQAGELHEAVRPDGNLKRPFGYGGGPYTVRTPHGPGWANGVNSGHAGASDRGVRVAVPASVYDGGCKVALVYVKDNTIQPTSSVIVGGNPETISTGTLEDWNFNYRGATFAWSNWEGQQQFQLRMESVDPATQILDGPRGMSNGLHLLMAAWDASSLKFWINGVLVATGSGINWTDNVVSIEAYAGNTLGSTGVGALLYYAATNKPKQWEPQASALGRDPWSFFEKSPYIEPRLTKLGPPTTWTTSLSPKNFTMKRKVKRQPRRAMRINWANPITRGLKHCVIPGIPVDLANGAKLSVDGTDPTFGIDARYGRIHTISGYSGSNGILHQPWLVPLTSEWTHFALMRTNLSLVSNFHFVSVYQNSATWERALGTSGSGYLQSYVYAGGGFAATSGTALANVPGKYYAVAGAGYVGNVELWVDGKFDATTSTGSGDTGFTGYGAGTAKLGVGFNYGDSSSIGSSSVGLVLSFARRLSAAEHKSLAANPWQIFEEYSLSIAGAAPMQPRRDAPVTEGSSYVITRRPAQRPGVSSVNWARVPSLRSLVDFGSKTVYTRRKTYPIAVSLPRRALKNAAGLDFSGNACLPFPDPEGLAPFNNETVAGFSFTRIALIQASPTTTSFATTISNSAFTGGTQFRLNNGVISFVRSNQSEVAFGGSVANSEVCVVAVSYDGVTGAAKLYKNGVQVASGTDTGTYISDLSAGSNFGAHGVSVSSEQFNGVLFLHAEFDKCLTSENIRHLSSNVWQIFRSRRDQFTVPGGTFQVLRPAVDITKGLWLPSTPGQSLESMIDETTLDGADYIYARTPSTARIALQSGDIPAVLDGLNLKYALSARSKYVRMKVRLKCGPDLIKEWIHNPLPTTPTTFKQTLSFAEAARIGSYTALNIETEIY